MTEREHTRRSVLKAGAALASIGVVGSMSGCVGSDNGLGFGSSTRFSMDVVPAGVDGLVHVDVDSLLGDDAVRSATNTAIADQEEVDVANLEEALDKVETELGLDPEGVNDVAVFGSDADDEGAVVAWTEYDSDELVSAIEEETDEEIEQGTYEGQPTFGTGDELAAELDDGVFVGGEERMVRRVVDTWRGEAEAWSGPGRDAFERAEEGYARFGLDLPPAFEDDAPPEFQPIESFSGSLYADGTDRVIEFSLQTETESDAETLEELLDDFMADIEQRAEEGESLFLTEELIDEITERVDYGADGTSLDIEYSASADDFADFIGQAFSDVLLDLLGFQGS